MKGCIFKRKLSSGKIAWGYSLDHGKGADGKRRQEFRSGFERKSQAEDILRRRLNQKDVGEVVQPDPTAFTAFLDDWFRDHADRQCAPKTVERYRELAGYLMPRLGLLKLQDITALKLERTFNELKDT